MTFIIEKNDTMLSSAIIQLELDEGNQICAYANRVCNGKIHALIFIQ